MREISELAKQREVGLFLVGSGCMGKQRGLSWIVRHRELARKEEGMRKRMNAAPLSEVP